MGGPPGGGMRGHTRIEVVIQIFLPDSQGDRSATKLGLFLQAGLSVSGSLPRARQRLVMPTDERRKDDTQ